MDGHTRQDGHALADLGGTGRNLLHIGKHMDKHDRQMGWQQFQHGPLSGKDTHEIRMHVHLVYAAFLVLESDQHMVQGDFKRLEETAGEELLLPVDTDFIQHLLLRYLFGLVKVLVEYAFGQCVIKTPPVHIKIQVVRQVVMGIFRVDVMNVFRESAPYIPLSGNEGTFRVISGFFQPAGNHFRLEVRIRQVERMGMFVKTYDFICFFCHGCSFMRD